MRIPRNPPDWLEFLRASNGEAPRTLVESDLEQFVRTANDRYLHWDKMRAFSSFRLASLPNWLGPPCRSVAVHSGRRCPSPPMKAST